MTAGSRHDYSRQALTYDLTRAASPSVVRPLVEALAGAPGPRLLDVGGGTGNYAAALRGLGFEPTVVDVSEAMLCHAEAKGLPTVLGDAASLPFADSSFDAAMLVSMIHHVADHRAALAEARRVLVPAGRLAVMGWAREHVEEVSWIADYFPSTRDWMGAIHLSLEDFAAELPGARLLRVFFEDTVDLSVGALQRFPHLLLDPERRAQTSYFERLADTAPDELERGTARLEADLRAGAHPEDRVGAARERIGDAFVLAWTKPA